MKFQESKIFIDLYDNNINQLIAVYNKLVGYADKTWTPLYLKKNILSKIENTNSLETILLKYIPISENYNTFDYDFFKYIFGLPTINQQKLERILYDWGLLYLDVIPSEAKEFIFKRHKNTLTVMIESYIKQSNEYSLIIKFFYLISLIDKKVYKNFEDIEKHFQSSNITTDGLKAMIFLLTKEYKILSTKTLEFITPKPILEWVEEYGTANIIVNLYDYILSKSETNYMDILYFLNSLESSKTCWICGEYLEQIFNRNDIETLYNLQILDKTTYESKTVYKMSNIGYILFNKELPNKWMANLNIVESKNLIFVPHNDNPILILGYLMKYTLTNPGNFLLIFTLENSI